MSLPEVLLWQALRKHQSRFKFRRQFPLLQFVFDFACLDARLLIEIDGEAHNRGDRPARDEVKNMAAKAAGFDILRITAADVLRDVTGTADAIVCACGERAPLYRPTDGPPPRAGEDLL